MSSIAADSSPFARTPAARNASPGTSRLLVADLRQPERVRKATRRIDGEDEDPSSADRRGGSPERGRDRRLADAARTARGHDLLRREQTLEASPPDVAGRVAHVRALGVVLTSCCSRRAHVGSSSASRSAT